MFLCFYVYLYTLRSIDFNHGFMIKYLYLWPELTRKNSNNRKNVNTQLKVTLQIVTIIFILCAFLLAFFCYGLLIFLYKSIHLQFVGQMLFNGGQSKDWLAAYPHSSCISAFLYMCIQFLRLHNVVNVSLLWFSTRSFSVYSTLHYALLYLYKQLSSEGCFK